MRAPFAACVVASLLAACAAPRPLQVIDNVLAHEGAAPPSPPLVRTLLARPLDAMDAAAIFARSVPAALVRIAEAAPSGPPRPLREAMESFLDELERAQRELRAVVPAIPALEPALPPPARQREIAAAVAVDAPRFLEAIANLRRTSIVFPAEGARFERGDIVVIVGTPGDDRHLLEPLRHGAVHVLIDPGGNDRYLGPDVVLHGLRAIVDLGGDDRYESEGPAWGAAVAGVSILLDASGSDVYDARDFGIGAALAGLGAVIDLAGRDTYRVRAFGQGLGLAGGTGVLWDRGGNDRYLAQGLPDPYDRGGGLSFAQGAAVGVRTGMGGGVGILRDDAGDDVYVGHLYAQGAGYYYALGVLWDLGGDDRYAAARYAQGAGVHQAVGVLRDESGDDTYELSAGVGQGMGLDLAVGVLADAGGDDRYSAPTLAQGAATDNGVGIIADAGGRDTWRLDRPPGRGNADGARGLPSVALVLADAPRLPARTARAEPEPQGRCPDDPEAAPASGIALDEALRSLGPQLASGRMDPALYRLAMRELRTHPTAAFALPAADFELVWPLAIALRCALAGATPEQASALWDAFEDELSTGAASPFAGAIAVALAARSAPPEQQRRLLAALAAHPSCTVRTQALSLEGSAAAAQAALRSGCWQLQARALRILQERGVVPADLSAVPPFLRPATARASLPAP